MAHEGYHEPIDKLTPATMDFHRAIVSLIEELEAVDWYNQRVDACGDPELHRRSSRTTATRRSGTVRNDARVDPPAQPVFDKELRDTLFKSGSVTGQHGG